MIRAWTTLPERPHELRSSRHSNLLSSSGGLPQFRSKSDEPVPFFTFEPVTVLPVQKNLSIRGIESGAFVLIVIHRRGIAVVPDVMNAVSRYRLKMARFPTFLEVDRQLGIGY